MKSSRASSSSGPLAVRYAYLKSPLGDLLVLSDAEGLRRIDMVEGRRAVESPSPDWVEAPEAFVDLTEQLTEYFGGARRDFDLPLKIEGTPFQLAVWGALAEIPYGTTLSYGELARRIGRPQAARAVGAANGQNPLPIVIPCHRVIGAGGALTGYGGGMRNKAFLLELERRHAPVPMELALI